MNPTNPQTERLMSIADVLSAVGISRAYLYAMWAQGRGPRRTVLGRRCFVSDTAFREWLSSVEGESKPGAKASSGGRKKATETKAPAPNVTGTTIEKGIPIPGGDVRQAWPFAQMEPGDSIFVEEPLAQKAARAVEKHKSRKGGEWTYRSVDGGIRIWRTA